MTLDHRVALVTGGASGIGEATVRALATQGAQVMVADVLDHQGRNLAESFGKNAHYAHLDVAHESDWQQALETTQDVFGPPSILINNAGILELGNIENQSPKSFRHVLDVNLYGAYLGMHFTAPLMHETGGVIINVSSTAGLMGYSEIGAYVASKWGLRGLTKSAALELGRYGIRVCSLHPGVIQTPMTAGMDETMVNDQPMQRFGTADEVATMMLFIIDNATYSTGCEFTLDGGVTAGTSVLSEME